MTRSAEFCDLERVGKRYIRGTTYSEMGKPIILISLSHGVVVNPLVSLLLVTFTASIALPFYSQDADLPILSTSKRLADSSVGLPTIYLSLLPT